MTKRLSAKCKNTNRKSFIQGHYCSFKIERGLRICNTWDKKEAKNATIKHCGHCRRPCNCAAKVWFTGQKKTKLAGSNRRGEAAVNMTKLLVARRFHLGKKEDANFLVVRNLYPKPWVRKLFPAGGWRLSLTEHLLQNKGEQNAWIHGHVYPTWPPWPEVFFFTPPLRCNLQLTTNWGGRDFCCPFKSDQ